MIKQISLSGFNSQTITHDLGQYTLLLGKRGSGKSSTCKAIQFVLNPIASTNLPVKFNEHYCLASKTEKFSATLTLDTGQTITRELSRSAKGEISQQFLDGNKILTRSQEIVFLQNLGIALPDIDNFLDLSDQKKIAYLFQIFPCEVDVEKISDQIDRSKETENELQRKILGKREAILSLEGQLVAFPIPSGATIKLLQGEITEIEKSIKDLEIQLREEEWSVQERQRVLVAEEEAKRREQVAAEKAVKLTLERVQEEKAIRTTCQEEKGQGEATRGIEREEMKSIGCRQCLTDLTEIIDKGNKAIFCYACKAEQMPFPEVLRLKMLKRRIQNYVEEVVDGS